MAKPDDFVYMDPPYIGRHTDYYNGWTQEEAKALSIKALALPCGFAASMWLENRHRKNEHVEESWSETDLRICSHFYHVGSSESLRNAMDEALLIRKGYATPDTGKRETKGSKAGEVVRSQTAEQIMLPF